MNKCEIKVKVSGNCQVQFQLIDISPEDVRDSNVMHISEFNARNEALLSTRSVMMLKSDIEEKGQISPIYVIKNDDGYEVLDGHRRLLVASILCISIKAFVTNARLNSSQKRELTNSLNCSKSHSLIEKGELYSKMMSEGAYKTQKEIADATEQSESQVNLAIRAFELPDTIKESFGDPNTLNSSQINELDYIKNQMFQHLNESNLVVFSERLYEEIIPDELEYELEQKYKETTSKELDQSVINQIIIEKITAILQEEIEKTTSKPQEQHVITPHKFVHKKLCRLSVNINLSQDERFIVEAVTRAHLSASRISAGFEKLTHEQKLLVDSLPLSLYVKELISDLQSHSEQLERYQSQQSESTRTNLVALHVDK